jgi:hypothetical protein
MTEPRWREAVGNGAIAFVFLAAFPRLGYRLRWPTRIRGRGLVAYTVYNALVGLVLRNRVLPYFERIADEQERAKEELRHQLGREPTEAELLAHLGPTFER